MSQQKQLDDFTVVLRERGESPDFCAKVPGESDRDVGEGGLTEGVSELPDEEINGTVIRAGPELKDHLLGGGKSVV
ncbi:hypothetical protein AB0L66_10295 [Streptomyces sp. NPDC052207]|uniref:hypothetical protein n=1 Tax=Streptomyces sp. NPDC052207 TaxID=3155418 RepID=UPI0034334BFC